MNRAKLLLLSSLAPVLPLAAGCKSAPDPRPGQSVPVEKNPILREPEEVAAALQAANDAFMDGRWGDAVVQANRVMEGNASQEQYYGALKILGLASCNRGDARPVAHVWQRLAPEDRGSLQRECAQNGILVGDDGKVTREPAPGRGEGSSGSGGPEGD
jgi:hypothetical protein